MEEEFIIKKKCARFTQWCKDVGILAPKLDYPAFFYGGLVGAKVNAPIEHREVLLFVPFKAIITLDKCLDDSNLKVFYQENGKLFSKNYEDWEQLVIVIFLMYQKQLGEDSFWEPYI